MKPFRFHFTALSEKEGEKKRMHHLLSVSPSTVFHFLRLVQGKNVLMTPISLFYLKH